jgi:hypothetical protein
MNRGLANIGYPKRSAEFRAFVSALANPSTFCRPLKANDAVIHLRHHGSMP